MTTLTAEQVAQLESTLGKRRDDLLLMLRDLSHALLPQTLDPETHRDEISVREAFDDVRNALEQHDRLELQQVEQALMRISQSRYGNCNDCGTQLSFERLAAAPYATRCIACQTAFERRNAAPRIGAAAG